MTVKEFEVLFVFLKQVFGLCKEKLEKVFHMAQKSDTKDPKVDKHWAHNFYAVITVCLSCSSFFSLLMLSANLHLKKHNCIFYIACLLLRVGWCVLPSLCAWHSLNQLWGLSSLLSKLWAPIIPPSPQTTGDSFLSPFCSEQKLHRITSNLLRNKIWVASCDGGSYSHAGNLSESTMMNCL